MKRFALSIALAVLPVAAQSADQPDPSPAFTEAKNLLNGRGVEKNPEKAFALFEKAAAGGDVDAEAAVGYLLVSGIGTQKDEVRGKKVLAEAAKAGSAKAAYNLAKLLIDAGRENVSEALALMTMAADKGMPEAELELADWYYFGKDGIPVDYAKAFPRYLAAADHGYANAQNTAGLMLSKGMGTGRDPARGVNYFKKAAAQGNAKAQVNLANALIFGNGIEKNKMEALKLLFIASSKGEVTAKNALKDYLRGFSTEEIAIAAKESGVNFSNPTTFDLDGPIMDPR